MAATTSSQEKLTYEKASENEVKDLSNSVSVPQVHQAHRQASRQQSTQVMAAAKCKSGDKSTEPSTEYYRCSGGLWHINVVSRNHNALYGVWNLACTVESWSTSLALL